MTENKEKLTQINMLNDAMFKALFRSIEARDMVSTFLSSLTGIKKEVLMNADYQGGELPKKNINEKGKTSDIIIKIEDNHKIILEMNQHHSDNIFEKNTGYVFSIASESTRVNSKKYTTVILINIDNFNSFNTKEAVLNFKLRDEYGHIETNQYHSIHLILENIVNKEYNEDEVIKKLAKFLKTSNLDEMEKEFEGDESYMACIRKVEDLSTDPNFIGYYDIEEARRQEIEDMKATGFRMGREEGRKEGRKEGREEGREEGEKNKQIEIAKSMLKDNLNVDIISKYTSLSEDEILNIN